VHQRTEPTEQAWPPNGFHGPPHWHRRAERWRNRGNGEPLRRDPEDRLAGGVAASALQPPRQFLGAARNVEDGGSLTILSTALVDNGSRLDDVLFEEFKGTGNMELRLRRELAEKRIFPAIDVMPSGTRHDELLMSPGEYQAVGKLRRALGALDAQQALELLLDKTRDTASNLEFLSQVQPPR